MKKIDLIVVISLIAIGLIACGIVFGTSYSKFKNDNKAPETSYIYNDVSVSNYIVEYN